MHQVWDERKMGWHEQVHERLGENLYYFFLKLSPFDTRRARQEIGHLIKEHQLGSVRAFEIFGAYDLLVRAWLHSNIVNQFRAWLTAALRDSLRATHIFEVTSRDHRWYRPADPKVLAKLDDGTIRAAQDRGAQLGALVESGVVTYRERSPNDEGLIRFFTTVYLEEVSGQEDVVNEVLDELGKYPSLGKYLTVDRGFGFCSLLIKGETPNYFEIANVPQWISMHYRARVTTETFLCFASVPSVGGEMIGEATFHAMAGKDLFVYALLPEFYEGNYDKKRKTEAFDFLRRLRDKTDGGLTLNEPDKAIIHDSLYGYLIDRPTDAAKALFGLFADTERYLRNCYREFLGRHDMSKSAPERAGVVLDGKKHVPLGDMLKILYQAGAILGDDRLKWESGGEFSAFRNTLMHGALDSVSLDDLAGIVDWLPGLRRLVDAIEEDLERPYRGS